ncbi:MAG: hypothetical protein MJ202_02155 [Lentisphaeria bacterium]|nr:hypothetical protein [Lentisphaeria bacterium]
MPHDDFLFPPEKATFADLKISDIRTEPLFWICEVRILSKFSPEKREEIRRISFRKGLNIVWAEPSSDFHSDDEQRIAGHATGKTTLCRMLRYLFGESTFANEQLRDSIFHRFPEGCVVGHIRINGEDWCAARAFAGHREYACKLSSLDDFLCENTSREKYQMFKEALEALLPQISNLKLLPGQQKLTFYHLLPLFTRDQDNQYTKLAEWRDNSLSGSASPVLQQKSAMLVMRSLISGIVVKEGELLSKQESLEEKVKETKVQHEILKNVLYYDRERLRTICHDQPEDAELEKIYIQGIRDNCNRRLASFCIDQDDEENFRRLKQERDCAWFEYQQAVGQYNAALRKYKQERREFSELQKLAASSVIIHDEEELNEIQEAALELPTRKYCCVPMTVAREHHCPWAEKYTMKEDIASKENLLGAKSESLDKLGDRAVELKNYYTFLQHEKNALLILKNKCDTKERDLNEFCAKVNSARNQRAAEEGNKLEAIQRYDLDEQRFGDITTQLNQYKEDLKKCNAEIAAYRKEATLVASDFSLLYDKVIRLVMGSKVTGRVRLNDGNIKLESFYHSADLQSAALDAVKNICFDIATMVYSVMGRGTHPRFLIHDGPRVSDVTRSIYLGYFNLMHELETASYGNPNFQYIITTTEPPPEELQSEPWIICKLDATDSEQRLLRCNLE